jgi:hypothetical protein
LIVKPNVKLSNYLDFEKNDSDESNEEGDIERKEKNKEEE